MPLPLTVSCFSKIQIGFIFLVPAHPGSPGKGAVKRVCVCVYMLNNLCFIYNTDAILNYAFSVDPLQRLTAHTERNAIGQAVSL